MLSFLFLVSPFEGEEIFLDLPLFTWTPVTPLSPYGVYRIQIVEILGPQTSYEAFRANPLFYESTNLRTNLFQYPIAARSLDPCATYAWRVSYELEERFTGGFIKEPSAFQQSELWTFITACDEEEEEK